MTRAARFKQADLSRAMKAAKAAGMLPRACTIDPDGTIRLAFTDDAANDITNPLDRVLNR